MTKARGREGMLVVYLVTDIRLFWCWNYQNSIYNSICPGFQVSNYPPPFIFPPPPFMRESSWSDACTDNGRENTLLISLSKKCLIEPLVFLAEEWSWGNLSLRQGSVQLSCQRVTELPKLGVHFAINFRILAALYLSLALGKF